LIIEDPQESKSEEQRPRALRGIVWRSPLRGSWLTAVLGLTLLAGLPVVMATGLLSNAAYDPRVAGNVLLQGRSLSPLDWYLFAWPTHPAWLYAASQSVHVSLGLALIPVVIVKQWSVLPRLLQWPSWNSPARMIERFSLLLLIAGIYFEMVTGVLFIEYWFPFRFDFTAAHYYGAWVFFGALVLHVAVKLPAVPGALQARRQVMPLGTSGAGAHPDPPGGVVARELVPATISRRTLLATVGAGSLLLGLQGAAQTVGGPVRQLAFMLPRGLRRGGMPNDFPVNGTFASLGLGTEVIEHWKLRVSGSTGLVLNLDHETMLKLVMHTYRLPLSCREGWSTTQDWTGVRLSDLAFAMAINGPCEVDFEALDGAATTLAANQVADPRSLIAVKVNGEPLSLDHGYPARVIIPAEVGVNCLKWVTKAHFRTTPNGPDPSPSKMPGMEAM
jgi:DMSO/TMAO reductase YedYZ molybdopterin-dependent catalytic subunit